MGTDAAPFRYVILVESDLYIALYGISLDAAGEATSQAWVTERMRGIGESC